MRVLALDQSFDQAGAALLADDGIVAIREGDGALAALAAEVLGDEGLDLIAVTVGPGRFTGIRAGLSLAHGIGLASGVPVVGVTSGEAIARALPHLGGRALWVAIVSRRGRVFIESGGTSGSFGLDSLPHANGPVAIAGDAAPVVASFLAAAGVDVMLTDARRPMLHHVAAAAVARRRGELPPRAAEPLYIDPPSVSAPGTAPRPPPAGP